LIKTSEGMVTFIISLLGKASQDEWKPSGYLNKMVLVFVLVWGGFGLWGFVGFVFLICGVWVFCCFGFFVCF